MAMKNKPKQAEFDQAYTPLARRFLWADSPSAVEKLIFYLACLCAVLFVLDIFIHRHTYVPGESLIGFYAIVGFLAFTGIVLGASQLRRLILRNENYYSPYSVDSEEYPEAGLSKKQHNSGGGNAPIVPSSEGEEQ